MASQPTGPYTPGGPRIRDKNYAQQTDEHQLYESRTPAAAPSASFSSSSSSSSSFAASRLAYIDSDASFTPQRTSYTQSNRRSMFQSPVAVPASVASSSANNNHNHARSYHHSLPTPAEDEEFDYSNQLEGAPQYQHSYDEYTPAHTYDPTIPAGIDEEVNPFDSAPDSENNDSLPYSPSPLSDVPIHDPISDGVFKQSKYYLYFTYFFSAWGDRMWEFAVIVFIMDLYPGTLLYASLFGLVEKLAAILGGPSVGRRIDKNDRLVSMRTAIVAQNASICIASIIFFMGLTKDDPNHTSSFRGVCYFFILWMGAIASLAAVGAKLAIHKDWVVVVAGDSPQRLTQLNSNMRRIDLGCNILAPLLVGFISGVSSSAAAVIFVAVWSFLSLFIEYRLVHWVYNHIPQLHGKEDACRRQDAAALEEAIRNDEISVAALSDPMRPLNRIALKGLSYVARVRVEYQRFVSTMKAYRAHRVFFASLAYCLLYVSVLSLGGIMSSWAKLKGMSDVVIAVLRALAAGVGISSTFCVARMIQRWGLVQAGLVSIWAQLIMLVPVALAFVYYFKDESVK